MFDVIALGSCILLIVSACQRSSSSSISQWLAVAQPTFTNNALYSGTIQQLKKQIIPSPADGVVVEMPFQYGEVVQAGDLLFKLSSTKFLTEYKSALMQYVKAKNDFNTSQTQLAEGKFLHKNQLISDDDFKMKQS